MKPHWGLDGARIESAVITAVDANQWTVSVTTVGSARRLHDCILPSPYMHPGGEDGIYSLPEVGASVYVCIPSEGDARPFILAYRPVVGGGGSYAQRRRAIGPGDTAVLSRDGNGVFVRRGGVTEVLAGSLCRTIYIAPGNKILQYAEQYDLQLVGASYTWELFGKEEDPDGRYGARHSGTIRQFGGDEKPLVAWQVGAQVDPDLQSAPLLSVSMWDSGAGDQTRTFHLEADAEGAFACVFSGAISIETASASWKTSDPLTVYGSAASAADRLLRSTAFLTDLQASLGELSVLLQGLLGSPGSTPLTTAMLSTISTALSAGNSYVTSALKSE